jgi:hypothetical protein
VHGRPDWAKAVAIDSASAEHWVSTVLSLHTDRDMFLARYVKHLDNRAEQHRVVRCV